MYLLKTNWRIFFCGIGLLFLPICFNEDFNGGWIPIVTYILLVAMGIFLLLQVLANVLKINILYLLIVFLIIEIGIFQLFHLVKSNQIKSDSLLQITREFYFQYDRNIPSFQIGLGRYDDELFYTLNSGKSINSNLEYSNNYQINSQGVRDDEASLNFPKIITLGDSHTMGWGVDQDETFSSLLERQLGQKVLNTGIVSYGSAREYLLFKKLKTDSCQVLIWQFCSNDVRENQSFLNHGNQLKISSKREYNFRYRRNFLQANYYPFKFSFEILAHQVRKLWRKKKDDESNSEMIKEVETFFSILKLLQKDFTGKIILFNLESFKTTDKYFLAFEKYIKEHQLEKIDLINFSEILNEQDYYRIDGHINKTGHQKVSTAIKKKIEKYRKVE